jgi:hypothetical protein
VKLAVLDFVFADDLFEKFWKDVRAIPQHKMIVGRSRSDNDVAALLRFCAKVAIEHRVDGTHGLRAAAERENTGVHFRRIVAVRQDDLIMRDRPTDLRRAFDHLGMNRLRAEKCERDGDCKLSR